MKLDKVLRVSGQHPPLLPTKPSARTTARRFKTEVARVMTNDIAACGYCQGAPRLVKGEGYLCETHDCPTGYCGPIESPENWDYLQNLIVKQRRKDFEAGVMSKEFDPDGFNETVYTFDDYLNGEESK